MTTLKEDESGKRYHHGDLRNTLVQLGTEMLAESGEAGLSLRKLAQRAGVSHNAPYQHFADKNALLAAIAEEGFRMLGTTIAEVQSDPTLNDTETRLVAAGRAYVNFATQHPSHLQVMFGPLSSSNYPSLAEASLTTFAQLTTLVTEFQARQTATPNTPTPEDAALMVWVVVHGLSTILIAEKIPGALGNPRTADQLAEQFCKLVLRAL